MMDTDYRFRFRQLSDGKWVGYMRLSTAEDDFEDADEWLRLPAAGRPLRKLERHNTLRGALTAYGDLAAKYGFDVIYFKPRNNQPIDEPKEEVFSLIDPDPVIFTEHTLKKVFNAFTDNGITDITTVMNIINTLHNSGVLFRERAK
jgi:hypothetical protein